MVDKNIYEFYKRAIDEKRFSDTFIKELQTISNKNELQRFIEEKVCTIAKSMKYNFTSDDLLKYEFETIRTLSEDELELINGGAGIKNLILGGVISLLTVGGGMLLSGTAKAELNSEQVFVSLDTEKMAFNIEDKPMNLTRLVNDKVEKSEKKLDLLLDDEAEKKQDNMNTSRIVQNSSDDKSTVTAKKTNTKIVIEGERADKSEINIAMDNEGETKDLSEVDNLKLIQKSTNIKPVSESKKLTYDQKLYALQAANMQDAYALLQSGVIKNLRLYGNISKVKFGKDLKRIYAEDEGDALSQMLFMLYPSPAGELNTTSHGTRFSFSENPIMPELMVKFFGILNDYRNGKIVRDKNLVRQQKNDEKIYFNQNFKKNDKETFLKFYGLDIAKLDEEMSNLSAEIQKINPQEETLDAKKQELQNLKNQKSALENYGQNLLSFISTLLEVTHYDSENFSVDMDKKIKAKENEIQQANKNLEKLNSQTKVKLSEAEKLKIEKLKAQIEKLNDSKAELLQTKQLKYPKYLAEKILMSYLIKTLKDNKEVESFYSALVKRLAQNKSNQIKTDTLGALKQAIEKENNRLSNLNKLVQSINVNINSPYKNTTFVNGNTFAISCTDNNKVTFGKDFADCAETAVRHVINLLSYTKEEKVKWNVLLKGKDPLLDKKLNEVLEAINDKTVVKFYDLKTRLQMFFLYQSDAHHSADDHSKVARTLWEYAICNMTEDYIEQYNREKADNKKMYAIKYKNGNYELYSGHINMMKLMYNIALALNIGEERLLANAKENLDQLSSLQNDIKNLYVDIQNKDNGYFYKAIKNIFSLFCSENVNIEDTTLCTYENQDIRGSIKVEVCGKNLNFKITHDLGHSYVQHTPFEFKLRSGLISKEYKEDDLAVLLLRRFDNNYNVLPCDMLYKIFSDVELCSSSNENIGIYKKYKVLSVFDKLEGEETNYNKIKREITDDVLAGAKFVKLAHEKSKAPITQDDTLLSALYAKFLAKYDGYNEEDYVRFNNCIEKTKKDNFSYIKLNETEAKLFISEKSIESDGTLIIPSKIEGLKVVRVAKLCEKEANENKLFICTKVVFDDDIEKLAIDPFTFESENPKDKKQRTSIQFGKKLKELWIGAGAFEGRSLTSEIKIPQSVKSLTVGENAFSRCKQLNCFTIEDSSNLNDLSIMDSAFKKSGLTEFKVPKSVTNLTIDDDAFNCKRLKNFIIEDGSALQEFTIGERAFTESGLEGDFKIPKSVKTLIIGNSAFESCENLKTFTIEDGNDLKEFSIGSSAFNESGLEKLKIPKSVVKLIIEDEAFSYCNDLKTFIIETGSQLTEFTLESRAFYESSLENFKIPKGVVKLTIGEEAFESCDKLYAFEIEDNSILNDLVIEKKAFEKSGLTTFNIPRSVEKLTIGAEAFKLCNQFDDFVIENDSNLKDITIGKNVFERNDLIKFNVPKSVENLTIEEGSFSKCNRFETFTLEKGIHLKELIIGDSFVFKGNNSEEILGILKSVEKLTIYKNAFSTCGSIKIFNLDECSNLKELTIGENAFDGSDLEKLKISPNIKKLTISNMAFYNYEKLKVFNVDECRELTELIIGKNAFAGSGLKELKIPSNVAKLTIGKNALKESNFEILKNVKNLTIVEDTLKEYDDFTTFNLTECVDLSELTISKNAFARSIFERLEISSSVKKLTIGNYAFNECKWLQALTIEENSQLEELIIGENVFNESGLQIFTIPQSVKILKASKRSFLSFKGIIYAPKHLKNQCEEQLSNVRFMWYEDAEDLKRIMSDEQNDT